MSDTNPPGLFWGFFLPEIKEIRFNDQDLLHKLNFGTMGNFIGNQNRISI